MNNEQLWSAVGKILAIIGGIVGVIKIVEWFTSPKGKLTASVQIVPFVLPSAFGTDKLSDYRQMWIAVVRNAGSKPCEGVTLMMPNAVIARIARAGSDTEHRKLKDGVIELGAIKPKEELTINAWIQWGFSDFGDVRLSYTSGVGKILPRADAPKFCHDIERMFPTFFSLVPFLLIAVVFGLVTPVLVERIKSKPNIAPQTNAPVTTNASQTPITNTLSAPSGNRP